MSAGKEAPEQKAIRLLNAAFRIKEPFNFDKPAPYMWAVSVFNLEKLVELAIAEEREANGWQPIETAPKDGTSLLGYWLGGKHECSVHATKFHCGRWWATNEDYQHSTPSYWMPLPAAPKDEVSKDA